MSSLKYWVWLSAKTHLKPVTRYELISAFEDPEKIYAADEQLLMERVKLSDEERKCLADKSLQQAGSILEQCHAENIEILTLNDSAYPSRLKNIYDPPIVLYIKGRLPVIDENAVIGVVGTRRASPYGIKMGRRIGYDITKGGGLVVTGLAAGVDSASAEGALLAGGSCLGVLGCAIDEIYPKINEPLFRDVTAVGALVSEYPPGAHTDKWCFPERNRIISGLSVGVTVIEAPKGSGALITANRALEQGREVFAVPGNADAPNCIGSNALIREGAALVSDGWDILSEFVWQFPEKLSKPGEKQTSPALDEDAPSVYAAAAPASAPISAKPAETGKGFVKLRERIERKDIDKPREREYIDLRGQLSALTETQLKIVCAIDSEATHVDDIVEKTGLNVPVVLSELTILQIKGYVSQESGKRFILNIKNYK